MLDPEIFLPVLSFLLITGLFIWALISMLTASSEAAGIPCPPGLCASNVYDGSRRCPESLDGNSNNNSVDHNPAYEACNAPDACTNPATPCVYISDELGTSCPGNPGYTGVCTGTCRCIERVVCPNWATVYFTPFVLDSFTTLVQNTTWVNAAGTTTSQTPLSPNKFGEGSGLCGVSGDNVSKIWPPDGCVRGKLGLNEADGLWYCMATDLECETLVRGSDGVYKCL